MSRIVLMMMAYWRKDCLLFTSCILKACWCSTLYWMSTYDPHLHIKENVYSHSCKLFIVLSWELCESTVVVLVKGSSFSNNSYFTDIQLAINFPADSPRVAKEDEYRLPCDAKSSCEFYKLGFFLSLCDTYLWFYKIYYMFYFV